jgi:signal transduction histidine kinase
VTFVTDNINVLIQVIFIVSIILFLLRERKAKKVEITRKLFEEEIKKQRDSLDQIVNERTREMKRAVQTAQDANRAKTEFLANMNHEIRTPLNVITGFSYLLKSELNDNQKAMEAVENIEKACENLTSIISDILDISKIEVGKMKLSPDFINIRGVFEEINSAYLPMSIEKKIDFEVFIDENVPCVVKIDGTRLRQIMHNLIGNSFKFTETGQIKVSVYASVSQIKGSVDITIAVKDTGIGIPAEQKEKMFEPFVQQDGQSTRKYGGTGLGLALCRKFAEMMGGAVSVESEYGHGSVFFVFLKNVEVSKDEGSKEGKKLKDSSKDVKFNGQKVLIAEDNVMNKEVLKNYLSKCNLTIFEVSNGRDAVSVARNIKPDLILMDILMPELDGLSASKVIRNNPQTCDIPIIAVTALAGKDQIKEIMRICNDLIEKPVKKEVLLEKISEIFSTGKTVNKA